MTPRSMFYVAYSRTLQRRVVWDCDLNANGNVTAWFTVRRTQEAYTRGDSAPHYPMPAPIMQIRHWPDLVTLHYLDGYQWKVKSTLNHPF